MKGMHRPHLIIVAVLLAASVGAAGPRVASASTPAAPPLYQTGGTGTGEFTPPAAPGETTAATSSTAVESAEPVEGAPGDTGIEDDERPDRPMTSN